MKFPRSLIVGAGFVAIAALAGCTVNEDDGPEVVREKTDVIVPSSPDVNVTTPPSGNKTEINVTPSGGG